MRDSLQRIVNAEFAKGFRIEAIDEPEREVIRCLLSAGREQRRTGWALLRQLLLLEAGPGPAIRQTSVTMPSTGGSAFISHASADKPIARCIGRELADRGISVWLDEWRIGAGQPISKEIDSALDSCTHVVLLLSPESMESPWVEREWRAAYWREVNSGTLHLIPVMVRECRLPPLLREKRFLELQQWSEAINELADTIAAG